MTQIYSNKMSLFFRVMVFVAIHIASFAAILKIECIWNFLPYILIIPLCNYLIIFFIEAKSRINKGMDYDEVWRGCFWFSFWAGTFLFLPFLIFGVGPDGPIRHVDYNLALLIGFPIGCAVVFGGLAGLVGTVLINQFYGVLGGNKGRILDKGNS